MSGRDARSTIGCPVVAGSAGLPFRDRLPPRGSWLVLTLLSLALLLPAGSLRADGGGAGDVVIVVSAANPLRQLSRQQVVDLFLGRSRHFPDGRLAEPLDQAEGSAVRQSFNRQFLERTPAQVRAHWARIIFTGRGRPPHDLPDGEAVRQHVATDPHAIAYLERRLVDARLAIVSVE